jgi:aminoglycoside phosphotransferase
VEVAHALSGDAGLAGVRWLLLDPRPRHALRHELAGMLEVAYALGPCRLRRAKFKPGRKLTAYFEADLRHASGRPPARRPIAVTWTLAVSERRTPASVLAQLEAQAAASGLATPFRALEAAAPALRMHVAVSPLDARFPHLMRLSDPSFLADVVPGDGWRVTPIRYRPGQRHVLRYDLERGPGSRETVFAKLYEDERGRRTFEVATRVASWLASNGAGGTVVRPLACVSDSRAVLYPALAGSPLSQRRGYANAEGAKRLRQAGVLLRALHRAPLALAGEQDPYRLDAELSAVTRASEHVRALLPGASSRIPAILNRARRLHDRLAQEDPTLVHGDFKLDHLWPSPAGMTLIDLDRCGVADPALDIGKLLADLHRWPALADHAEVRQAQGNFLDGYVGPASAPRVRRARVYEAVLLVKIAARRVPLFDLRWSAFTDALIGRAETTLTALERECRASRAPSAGSLERVGA